MTSTAYQQSAVVSADAFSAGSEADPTNLLWWRFDPRRLSSEELRDSLLTVSGEINLAYGGESFFEKLPAEVLATASTGARAWGTSPPEQQKRRSIYMKIKRSLTLPLMTDFDQADTDNPCPTRFSTTVPTQALNLINSEYLTARAQKFAQRLQKEKPQDLAAQCQRGWELVTQRTASSEEINRLLATQADFRSKHALSESQALERLCLLLLNLNEFIFLD
jgi:hypothetical protein